MKIQIKTALFFACTLLATTPVPQSRADVIQPDLQIVLQDIKTDEISVIVTLADRADLRALKAMEKSRRRAEMIKALKVKADSSQKSLKDLLKIRNVKKAVSLWAINGIAVTARPAVIRELADLPGIESIKLDSTLNAPETTPGKFSVSGWNLEMIRAPEIWAMGYTGGGAVVASMDTGVDVNHPDLAGKWSGGTNSWYDPYGQHDSPYDNSGHGTQVMGLIVGGDAGASALGTAPDAKWIAVKIFDDSGVASLSAIHMGFQWLLNPDGEPDTDDAPDVINNSWGFPEDVNRCYLEFQRDIEVLRSAGIAVVFSAGNQGPSDFTSISPANNNGGFAVGAVTELVEIAPFSSRGPSACNGSFFPDVTAPGVNLRTTDLTYGGMFPDSYIFVTGTSFSAAHASGAIALLSAAFPEATLTELEWVIQENALDLGTSGADNVYGYGLIDIVNAFNALAGLPVPVCTDNDRDGYFTEADCGTLLDCNDFDSSINPGACDIKRDGIDQDCDGKDRRKGRRCFRRERRGRTCFDRQDNDGDGLIDCADPGCSRNPVCRPFQKHIWKKNRFY